MCTHMCANYIFQSCNISTFTTAYFCFKSFDMLMPKRQLKDLRFCTLLIIFKWWHCKCAIEKGKETVVCMFMFDNQLLFVCSCLTTSCCLYVHVWQPAVVCMFMFDNQLLFVCSCLTTSCCLYVHVWQPAVVCMFMFDNQLLFVCSCLTTSYLLAPTNPTWND